MISQLLQLDRMQVVASYFQNDKKKQQVSWPKVVPLKYNSKEYEAYGVTCGPTYTFVIGKIWEKQKTKIEEAAEHKNEKLEVVRESLLKVLNEHKNLSSVFGDESQITRSLFITSLDTKKIVSQHEALQLAPYLFEGKGEKISAMEIEDFALGYKQDERKLFLFGNADQRLFAFQNTKKLLEGNIHAKILDTDYDSDQSSDSSDSDNQTKQAVVCYPTAIKFPKLTRVIDSVSCGQSHALALTIDYKMFSWGAGYYGALGFGSKKDVLEPTELKIGQNFVEIEKVVCGRLHSICITKRKRIFSWGTGLNGRLGHGNTEEVLEPKEITQLSNFKVIDASAGESHSAAITQNFRLYTWGNGVYGRLGTGFDQDELKPKFIEEITVNAYSVSCGSFHTLLLTSEGKLFAFGQDKYGKLGLSSADEGKVMRLSPAPVQIFQATFNKFQKQIEQPENAQLCQIVAGANHNLAVQTDGCVISWGYNGFNLLGRKYEKHQNYNSLPMQIGTDFRINKKLYKHEPKVNTQQLISQMQSCIPETNYEISKSTQVTQVACTSLNTAVVTNAGELYITGSNVYNQLGVENIAGKLYNRFICVPFFKNNQLQVCSISCGSEHIFAITNDDIVYGWGRNSSGQLGMDYISNTVSTPSRITSLNDIQVKKIECGDNYSAVITQKGQLLVTGEMDGGKIGLGKAFISGNILSFKEVSSLQNVKSIACGPNHMLAIIKDPSKEGRRLFAWGRNFCGQLGIGNLQDSLNPKEVKCNANFKKVSCGRDFSLALSEKGYIYVWGNSRYACNDSLKDNTTPIELKNSNFQNMIFKEIACSYHYCTAINSKNEVWVWGELMKEYRKKFMNQADYSQKEKRSSDPEDAKQEVPANKKPCRPQRFPAFQSNNSFFQIQQTNMKRLAIGQNHVAGISVDKKLLFCWGLNDCLQIGPSMSEKETANAIQCPVGISQLNEILLQNQLSIKSQNENKQIVSQGNNQISENGVKRAISGIINENSSSGKIQQQTIQTENLEEQIERKSLFQTEKPKPKFIQLIGNLQQQLDVKKLGFVEDHKRFQIYLQNEKTNGFDKNSIYFVDKAVQLQIQTLITSINQLKEIESQIKAIKLQIKNNIMQRVIEYPYITVFSNDPLIYNKDFLSMKKLLKLILLDIHIHPCYLINLYISNPTPDFYKILKAIYPNKQLNEGDEYQTNKKAMRVNFQLLSIMKKILPVELHNKKLTEIDFLSSESLTGKIFKYIFKSQSINLDSIGTFVAHLINCMSKDFKEENTEDVTNDDEIQMDKYLSFIKEFVIQPLIDNTVLSNNLAFFHHRKKISDELKKGRVIPSMRLSPEINLFIDIIYEALNKNQHLTEIFFKTQNEHLIICKLLPLVFFMMRNVWNQWEFFMIPYFKKKQIQIQIAKYVTVNKKSCNQIFELIERFFSGQPVFPEHSQLSSVIQLNQEIVNLNPKLQLIFQHIHKQIPNEMFAFNQFQNLVEHCLEPTNFKINIHSNLLYKLINSLMQNKNSIALCKPVQDDQLFIKIAKIKRTSLKILDCNISIQIPSRLLFNGQFDVAICTECKSVLTNQFYALEKAPIVPSLSIEDSEQIFNLYCEVLRQMVDIVTTKSVSEQISEISKRSNKLELISLVQKLQTKIELECLSEDKDPESIYTQLLEQGQRHINYHKTHFFTLNSVEERLNIISQNISKQLPRQNENLKLYTTTMNNILFGLANQELIPVANQQKSSFTTLKYIINHIQQQNYDRSINSMLKNNNIQVNAIIKKEVPNLVKNGTITQLQPVSLKQIQNYLLLHILESPNGAVEIKMTYTAPQNKLGCFQPKNTEKTVLSMLLTQEEIIHFRKQVRDQKISKSDKCKISFKDVVEFDIIKLLELVSEMVRKKNVYSFKQIIKKNLN